jgi:hypothetical protein
MRFYGLYLKFSKHLASICIFIIQTLTENRASFINPDNFVKSVLKQKRSDKTLLL